ncbi:MAG: ATP-binding protein [Chloroflexi bacterium]|nr:ATP-binding protein [Chloroflexota bacterium]MDA8189759.1 ATP-binding protein [Dehalococcoidales bacterium]
MIADVLRLAKSAPDIARLLAMGRRAMNGDPEAIQYFLKDGCIDALEIVSPGAGKAVREMIQHIQEAAGIASSNGVIEGQYKVIDERAPWSDMVTWLKARRWGTFVVLGPKGQGKTTISMRLAETWHQQTGWPVEAINVYPEDQYYFVQAVPTSRFIRTIEYLMELLNPEDWKDEDGELHEVRIMSPEELDRALEPYRRRIIVIDEMSLAVASNVNDSGRRLVRQIMAQARHLQWLIIYIGQLTKMMPTDLLGCEAVFIKRPGGREVLTDRQEPLTQDLWARAIAAFEGVRQSPYWYQYPDERMWAYVDAQDIGGGHKYEGLMPYSRPGNTSEGRAKQ